MILKYNINGKKSEFSTITIRVRNEEDAISKVNKLEKTNIKNKYKVYSGYKLYSDADVFVRNIVPSFNENNGNKNGKKK